MADLNGAITLSYDSANNALRVSSTGGGGGGGATIGVDTLANRPTADGTKGLYYATNGGTGGHGAFYYDNGAWVSLPLDESQIISLVSDLGLKGDKAGTLAQFAATTSAQLAGVLSDETGSGAAVFGTAPTISAPNVTGHPTIEGVTSTGATGTGKVVFDHSPTLVTPNLGTPSAIDLTNATNAPADSTKVAKAGDTMTGPLTVSGTGTGAALSVTNSTDVTATGRLVAYQNGQLAGIGSDAAFPSYSGINVPQWLLVHTLPGASGVGTALRIKAASSSQICNVFALDDAFNNPILWVPDAGGIFTTDAITAVNGVFTVLQQLKFGYRNAIGGGSVNNITDKLSLVLGLSSRTWTNDPVPVNKSMGLYISPNTHTFPCTVASGSRTITTTTRALTSVTTTSGSTAVSCAGGSFTSADLGSPISGTNIVAGARIKTITSGTVVQMTDAATGSSSSGTATVGLADATVIPVGSSIAALFTGLTVCVPIGATVASTTSTTVVWDSGHATASANYTGTCTIYDDILNIKAYKGVRIHGSDGGTGTTYGQITYSNGLILDGVAAPVTVRGVGATVNGGAGAVLVEGTAATVDGGSGTTVVKGTGVTLNGNGQAVYLDPSGGGSSSAWHVDTSDVLRGPGKDIGTASSLIGSVFATNVGSAASPATSVHVDTLYGNGETTGLDVFTLQTRRTIQSGNYSVANSDNLVMFTNAGSVVTLPDATDLHAVQRVFYIKNKSAGNISFATTSSQTVDGSTTGTIIPNQCLTVISDGSNWVVV